MKHLYAILLMAALANAADVSGKWTGTAEVEGENGGLLPASMEFKQTGNVITGSVWKEDNDRYDIEKGKVDGREVMFEFTAPEAQVGSAIVHKVRLTLVGEGRLEGDLQFEVEGNKASAKLKLERAK